MAKYIALKKCTIQGTEYDEGESVILHPHLARGLVGDWLKKDNAGGVGAGGNIQIKDMLKSDIIAELKRRKVAFSARARRGQLADMLTAARSAPAKA